MKRRALFLALPMMWLVAIPKLWSGLDEEKGRAELAKAVAETKVSLGQGVSASTSEGKPISAKFEMEEGKLQLSVYTAKGDKFSEVIIDHNTGKVPKSEAITSGEDLTAAKA